MTRLLRLIGFVTDRTHGYFADRQEAFEFVRRASKKNRTRHLALMDTLDERLAAEKARTEAA
ncbi:hypothetical protein [Hyphobacterium marinum]|uniref:Uncharacterized protein n=1 Tax=Hyphobacterium marinum TaxID=3116574 RepID=A0ABU7M1P6_9PROT|nr:hypothetical protein [Hyphobacterium sp. Y6023]MEE2567742.1 hypothetical protein [Hyphobacterium sp. Y6023]